MELGWLDVGKWFAENAVELGLAVAGFFGWKELKVWKSQFVGERESERAAELMEAIFLYIDGIEDMTSITGTAGKDRDSWAQASAAVEVLETATRRAAMKAEVFLAASCPEVFSKLKALHDARRDVHNAGFLWIQAREAGEMTYAKKFFDEVFGDESKANVKKLRGELQALLTDVVRLGR